MKLPACTCFARSAWAFKLEELEKHHAETVARLESDARTWKAHSEGLEDKLRALRKVIRYQNRELGDLRRVIGAEDRL